MTYKCFEIIFKSCENIILRSESSKHHNRIPSRYLAASSLTYAKHTGVHVRQR